MTEKTTKTTLFTTPIRRSVRANSKSPGNKTPQSSSSVPSPSITNDDPVLAGTETIKQSLITTRRSKQKSGRTVPLHRVCQSVMVRLVISMGLMVLMVQYRVWTDRTFRYLNQQLYQRHYNQHWHYIVRFSGESNTGSKYTNNGNVVPSQQQERRDVSLSALATHDLPSKNALERSKVLVKQQYSDNATQTLLPTDLLDLNSSQWHNDYNLVHIIQTRFMQHQPNLLHLARARLMLFETATLPSIRQQHCNTTHHDRSCFLWMLRVDPALHQSILNKLLQLVSTVDNLVVIASNDNPFFRHHLPNVSQVISGSFRLWNDYYEAARTRLVLETRLDADDALRLDFVQRVQNRAAFGEHTLQNNDQTLEADSVRSFQFPTGRPWLVWCVQDHWEWQQYAAWNASDTRGSLTSLRRQLCVTPGLTWALPPLPANANVLLPTLQSPLHQILSSPATPSILSHHQIHKLVPECRHDQKTNGKKDRFSRLGCLEFLKVKDHSSRLDKPLALRLRTMTSAGMNHLVLTDVQSDRERRLWQQWNARQNVMWEKMPVLFGVLPANMIRMRAQLETNVLAIVKDAEKGQCTPGHSCKQSARDTLRALRLYFRERQATVA